MPAHNVALPAKFAQGSAAFSKNPEKATQEWWRIFKDDTLNRLEAMALEGSPTLLQAAAKVNQARFLTHSQIAGLRPRLDAVAEGKAAVSRKYGIQDNGTDLADPYAEASTLKRREKSYSGMSGLAASWEIPLWDRASQVEKAALAGERIAEEELAGAWVSLTAQVATEYLALRRAQAEERLLRSQRESLADMASLTLLKNQAGLASKIEADRAGMQAEEINTRLPVAAWEITARKQRLASLCGVVSVEESLRGSTSLPMTETGVWRLVPADLLRIRPDVRRAQAEVLLAGAEMGIARAELYPRLQLSGLIAVTGFRGDRLMDSLLQGSGGALFSVPLFDWGLRQARYQAKGAELVQAIHSYRDTVLLSYQEAEEALAGVQRTAQSLQAAQTRLEAAQRVLDNTAILRGAGLKTQLDVLQVLSELFDAEAELLRWKADSSQSLVTLARVMGGALLGPNPINPEMLSSLGKEPAL